MPSKKAEDFQYLSNNPDYIPNPEIESAMEDEINRAPKDREAQAARLREYAPDALTEASGDPDAQLEDIDDIGDETVMGHDTTPEANDTEDNAAAIGVTFQDNQELNADTFDRRDRNRFELDPRSKTEDNSI